MKNPCHGCEKRDALCHVPGNCHCEPSYSEWIEYLKGNRKPDSQKAKSFLIDSYYKSTRKKNI